MDFAASNSFRNDFAASNGFRNEFPCKNSYYFGYFAMHFCHFQMFKDYKLGKRPPLPQPRDNPNEPMDSQDSDGYAYIPDDHW